MTNKEAIEILKTESCADCSCHPESPMSCINTKCPLIEATLLAIKALEDSSHIIEALEELKDDTLDALVSFGVEKSIDCIKNMRRSEEE